MAKSNIDRIQNNLEIINESVGLALDYLDAAQYESLAMQLEDIIEEASIALNIMEQNDEFQND